MKNSWKITVEVIVTGIAKGKNLNSPNADFADFFPCLLPAYFKFPTVYDFHCLFGVFSYYDKTLDLAYDFFVPSRTLSN